MKLVDMVTVVHTLLGRHGNGCKHSAGLFLRSIFMKY